MFRVSLLAAALLAGTFGGSPAGAGEVLSAAPRSPDASARYLFYMHGGYPEKKGGNADYRYNAILSTLADKGFVVIGEVRGQTRPGQYAKAIAGQVRGLLNAGVPVANITVAGHSKGGFMTLLSSIEIGNPSMKFAVMAACGLPGTSFNRTYAKFTKRAAKRMQGRFLVAWAEDDDVAGACDKAMNRAGVRFENKVLPAGRGHRLFYTPEAVWIDVLVGFAAGG